MEKYKLKTSFLSLFDATNLAVMLFVLQLTSLAAESLWKEDVAPSSMFADKKAHRVGDIVTVVISGKQRHVAQQQHHDCADFGRRYQYLEHLLPGVGQRASDQGRQFAAMSLSGKNTFNGGGQIANQETINAQIAVKVIDVLPNGNLVVEGRRQTAFSGEKQEAVLRGTVRADDVSANNTVFSYNIADASIQYISHGTITDAQTKGLFTKLWDKISPF
jgi:flagellar L-ring protein FlgH